MNTAKIGIVCARYGMSGGTEILAQRVAEYAASDPTLEVHILSSKTAAIQQRSGLHFHSIPRKLIPHPFRRVFFAAVANRRANHLGLDLVHSFGASANAHIISMGTPHLYWLKEVQGLKRISLKDRLTVALEERTLLSPSVKKILAVSHLAATQLKEYYPTLEKKIVVLEPGFDRERFNVQSSDSVRCAVRSELGFLESDLVGLFVGNNLEHKGLSQVLNALRERRSSGRATKLIVIGRGDIPRYQHEIAQRGLTDDVRLLGEVRQGVERYFLASDFFLLLSALETFCIAVLEAMAARLPVIITRDMGVAPLVEEAVCGHVVEKAESEAQVVEAIQRCEDPKHRRLLGERGFQSAQHRDWDHHCDAVLSLYKQELLLKV